MKILTFLAVLAISSTSVLGQVFSVSPNQSSISITGTSTLHDWEVSAKRFSGSARFEVGGGQLISVSELELRVEVKSIESGKGGMDKKIYEALSEKNHKEIVFIAQQVGEIKDGLISATGNLTIAGVTKSVDLNAAYEVLPDGSFIITGAYPMEMTSFNIEPPTAMLGTIKSGNSIEVKFATRFVNQKNS